MKAQITNYRQSPRKVRLVADLIRGKKANLAKDELEHSTKRTAGIFIKLIDSAIANAKNNFKMETENLVISGIFVDQGVTLKRIRPRSKGMAHRINKRTSNIVVKLSDLSTQSESNFSQGGSALRRKAEKESIKKKSLKKTSAVRKALQSNENKLIPAPVAEVKK